MKQIKFIALASVVMLLVAAPVLAAEFLAPESKTDANISTLQQEVHKNLYIAGGSVTVNSNTQGDLVAAGGVVTVNGNVEKDLLLGGGHVNLNAAVGENARIGGGNVSINGAVGGDLVVGGGNVTVAQKATVGGDLVVGGGNVSIDSNVAGNVKIGGGSVTINGKVSGNVDVVASENLTFGPASEVTGKITFKGPKEAVVKPGAKVGTINYTVAKKGMGHKGGFIGILIVSNVFKLIMLLVAGLALAWLVPHKVAAVSHEAIARPLPNFGIGILGLILFPILGVILMVTVVGLYLGMITLLAFGLLVVVSSVLVAFYTGQLVWSWYRKDAVVNQWRSLGTGVLVLFILGLIPIVGWIAACVLWLITMGALTTHWRKEVAHDHSIA